LGAACRTRLTFSAIQSLLVSLYLSAHTIKSHINRIFAKTGSADPAAAVRYALDQHVA
jgi:DNA-binding CsgD family transcriptional regulator